MTRQNGRETVVAGDAVVVRTADGRWLQKVAVSECISGRDFPIVWACWAEEFVESRQESRPVEATPWPCEDVFPTDSAPEDATAAESRDEYRTRMGLAS